MPQYIDVRKSLNAFFDALRESVRHGERSISSNNDANLIGVTVDELEQLLSKRLKELDRSTSLTMLASIETMFKCHYLDTVYQKKGHFKKHFRAIYEERGQRVSLDRDIFTAWKKFGPTGAKILIDRIQEAFGYRDWLAHGRYWRPDKKRSKPDKDATHVYENIRYLDMYVLADLTRKLIGL